MESIHVITGSSPDISTPFRIFKFKSSRLSSVYKNIRHSTSNSTDSEDPSASTSTPIVKDSSSDDEHKASHTKLVPPMPPPAHDHSTKPSSASWFTFDDIPRHKWPARLQEFTAWIDLQGTKPNAQSQAVLREFMARSTEQDDQTAFIIAESSDSKDISVISTVQNVNHVSTILRPSLKMSILLSKFHKPVPIIGFLDTGVDTNGQYQPGPHIATELLKFSATNLTKKQIQQFLGIVNYVRDFIPKVAIHTSQLSRILKKLCPPWGPAQTETVKQLKVIAQSPPPLKIPSTGQRILQTDASDDYWSAILLEEINGVRHFCAHTSGEFKDSKKNYHVIYKEILPVKKGLPVTARIALLDTRFKQYQHAVIGTVLTTLHAGSVLLTFYPNFNLSLEDPNLPTTIKVQIQLQGADQTPTSKLATLHHQIVYRLQNHALDLPTPYTTSDALMILFKQQKPRLKEDKMVKSPPVPETLRLSYTTIITAVQTGQEKKLPIHGVSLEGYPVYLDKINGHFLWDVPEAHMCNPDCPCLDDTEIDDELEVLRRKKKKKTKASHPKTSCNSFSPQSPPDPKPHVQSIRSCLMFSVTASGQPEEPKQYEAVLNWQTRNANAQNQTLKQLGKKIDPVASQVSQTETKVDSISHRLDQIYIHLQDCISELDTDLRRMINNHICGLEFNKKEAEIRQLKAELARIDAEKTHPTLFTQTQSIPVPPPVFETYSPFYTPPRPPQPPQPTLSSSVPPIPPEDSPKATLEPSKKDKRPMDQYHYHIVQDSSSDSSNPETVYESNPSESTSYSSSSSTNSTSNSTDFESEYADITSILMATKAEDPSASTSTPIKASHTEPVPPMPPLAHDHSTKPSSASWFTFDDILCHKWPARLQEFVAWIDLKGTKPNAQSQAILREFMARSTSSLRDWLESLGEYRLLQFMQSPVGTALNIIHEQFIGEKIASTDADRKEYHQMKCCSLKRHLLESHYKRMSILFYKLNGSMTLLSSMSS
ncbi:hypothetical protein KPL71_014562 [Citrus sinensis]|uniref:Uncharacterized protein n=1 Tax=Citrus sinensis TaxID=2711 RepID=A0ACB8KCF4_CITSI|nr:hypothetical protein KPL71_014562 [Citrus sinensis]